MIEEIALITDRNVIGDETIIDLKRKLSDKRITGYDSVQKLINNTDKAPHVIIIDMNKNILKAKDYYESQGVKIIVCISMLNWERVNELFSIGFDGYFFQEMTSAEAAAGIQVVLNGDAYIHPRLSEFILQHPDMRND